MGMEGGGIPVFNGKEYEIWSKKMKTLFVSQGLWGLVQKGYEEEATEMGGLRENRMKDCKALYLIQQGVSDSIFPVIINANTSKEAWEVIRDRFHHHGRRDQQQIEEIEEEMARTTIHIDRMLSKLNPIYPERCIFRVPDALRLGNEEFYEPTVLSIGPYHRGKPRLASMEEHKIRYLQQLLQRMGEQSVDRFVRAVMPQEQRVRKCYAEPIDSVCSDELIKMLVLDGCFIIELFRRFKETSDWHYQWFHGLKELWDLIYASDDESRDNDPETADDEVLLNKLIKDDPVINSDVLLNELQNDLLLIENQIPFFVLEILYGIISATADLPIENLKILTISFLCRKYLIYDWPQRVSAEFNIHEKFHLLDIAHKTVSSNRDKDLSSPPSSNNDTFCFVNSATKLEEANVRLRARQHFESIFDITFSKGELIIPTFAVDYHLEVDIRNFIALELCQKHRNKRYYCDYVVFMDHLIASSNDVELLIHHGIITNQMIDANFVDNMFQRLTRNIVTSDPYTYHQISKELNKYCARPRNRWSASLKHKYCQSPWTLISIIAAFMLLALTITQTVYSVISYYK